MNSASGGPLIDLLRDAIAVRSTHHWSARAGVRAAWPRWVPAQVVSAYERLGITAPWQHQVVAAEAAHAGRHVVLATGTASGKSLGYLLPVLAATSGEEPATGPARRTGAPNTQSWGPAGARGRIHSALYLSPTKALAHDQLRAGAALRLPSWLLATLDGDTEPAVRDWVREYAGYILSNPDMLHRSMLPNHARWAPLLRTLRYVVIDEAHRYRGVFGAHVAAVLARLRRLARHYGADPIFVLASATVANPGEAAARLIGVTAQDVTVVDEDTSARGPRSLVLWQPESDPDDDAARLLADLVSSGRQTLVFTGSRRSAERVAILAQRLAPDCTVASYRAGYLADERRRIEQDLQSGRLRGVASTNALELGVDIAGMDAVILDGYPGSQAAFWQQAGRAGRGGGEAMVVLVSRRHPLDAYLLDQPDTLLSGSVEATVLHPDNPYVLAPHLAAAAQELPLRPEDSEFFGPATTGVVAELEQRGLLRRRSSGWYATGLERMVDSIDLRSAGSSTIEIVEASTGRVLGTVDPITADATVHPGAVYLHQGETYVCDELAPDAGEALVRSDRPGYLTQPRRRTGIHVVAEHRRHEAGLGRVAWGQVEVRSQVTGYLRRDEVTGAVWDQTPLDLPVRTLSTIGVWITLDAALVDESISFARIGAGAHAMEHLLVSLLPLFAPCEIWDVGGVAVSDHADTGGGISVFVYDAVAGGAGFAERAYEVADDWVAAAQRRIEACGCAAGCPACVVSAACGSASQALDKAVASVLLGLLASTDRAEAAER